MFADAIAEVDVAVITVAARVAAVRRLPSETIGFEEGAPVLMADRLRLSTCASRVGDFKIFRSRRLFRRLVEGGLLGKNSSFELVVT